MIHQREDIRKAVHIRFPPNLGLLLLGEAMLKIYKTTAYKDNQALAEKGSRFGVNRQRMQEEKKPRFTLHGDEHRTEMRRATMERWSIMANLYRI